MDKYSIVSLLGQGACGDVYHVIHKETQRNYAVKKIILDESRKSRTKEAVLREARILATLKHPHIVAFHESFFDSAEKVLFIVQDYCDGGNLSDHIKDAAAKNSYFPEKEVLHITLAVRFMHLHKVLHRDLKTENVFLNKPATLCKLGDFGIAKSLEDNLDVAKTCVGTPCYLSPEMCQDIPYSSQADIWSLGCMLYEMAALHPAFDAFNLISLFFKIIKGKYEPLPDCYSKDFCQLVDSILHTDPTKRPSAQSILKMPYVMAELVEFINEKESDLKCQRQESASKRRSRPYTASCLASENPTSTYSVNNRTKSCGIRLKLPESVAEDGSENGDISAASTPQDDTEASLQELSNQVPAIHINKTSDLPLGEPAKLHRVDRPPVRTPRVVGSNAMVIHQDDDSIVYGSPEPAVKPHGIVARTLSADSYCLSRRFLTPVGRRSAQSTRSSRVSSSDKLGRTSWVSAGSQQSSGSRRSAESDCVDDFYEAVEIDEDIPEELPTRNTRSADVNSARVNSAGQCETSEVVEELPDGQQADDDDSSDDDDMSDDEDGDVEEYLGEVLTAAKEACNELDSCADDEPVLDHNQRPKTAGLIKSRCMEVLGQETFDKVTRYCETNGMPEMRRLENMVGCQNTETAFVVTQLVCCSAKRDH